MSLRTLVELALEQTAERHGVSVASPAPTAVAPRESDSAETVSGTSRLRFIGADAIASPRMVPAEIVLVEEEPAEAHLRNALQTLGNGIVSADRQYVVFEAHTIARLQARVERAVQQLTAPEVRQTRSLLNRALAEVRRLTAIVAHREGVAR